MKRLSSILVLLGMALFILSFFWPSLKLTEDLQLKGYETFAAHVGSLYYVHTSPEYLKWFFLTLTNIWGVFLFVRFWRKDGKKWLTLLIGALTLSSALFWMFDAQLADGLLLGYWMWVLGLVLLVLANVFQKNEVSVR